MATNTNEGRYLGTFFLGLLGLYALLPKKTSSSNNEPKGQNSDGGGNGFVPVSGSPGSLDESYLDIPNANLTTRYNNPLAVKYYDHNNWNGKILRAPGETRKFEKFIAYPYGVRVGIYLLKYRYLDAGYNTVESIIKKFAPLADNGAIKQGNYIWFVSKRLGVNKNSTLTNNKETLKKLVQAMARIEGGQSKAGSPELVTDAQFETGWSIL